MKRERLRRSSGLFPGEPASSSLPPVLPSVHLNWKRASRRRRDDAERAHQRLPPSSRVSRFDPSRRGGSLKLQALHLLTPLIKPAVSASLFNIWRNAAGLM